MDLSSYKKYLQKSFEDPVDFWSKEANKLRWTKKWTQVMDQTNSPPKWFVGGELNACDNCVDRHVEAGHGNKVAFIYDSPVTDTIRQVTFNELLDETSKVAGVLSGWGLRKGDIVVVYMPMIPEAFAALLACARLGVIHNAVPGGLPPEDLSIRIQHSEPKVIISASYGYHHPRGWVNYKENIDRAIELSTHKPQKCLMYQRPGMDKVKMTSGSDVDWKEAVSSATPHGCVPIPATDSMFMLYTSGSTGVPKAIVHTLGSFLTRLASSMVIYTPRKQDVIFATSILGWMIAHSLVIYGPLMKRIKTIILEGDHLLLTDPRTVYRIIDKYQVTVTIIRSGIIRAMKAKDLDGSIAKEYNFQALKALLVGAEQTDIPTVEWAHKTFRTYVQNTFGQSESGGATVGVPLPNSINYFMTGYPFPGYNVQVIDTETMTPMKPGETGRVLIKFPLPPGMLRGLFKNEELGRKTYFDPFPGYYDSKDEGHVDVDGTIKIEHRVDAVTRVGQIYIATTSIEQKILENPAVEEVLVAVKPQPHDAGREILVAIVVVRKGQQLNSSEVVQSVKNHFGQSVPFEAVVCVTDLPRTSNGKLHRPSIITLLKGLDIVATGGIENPEVLQEIRTALRDAGLDVK